jgi:hypothetical protein
LVPGAGQLGSHRKQRDFGSSVIAMKAGQREK